MFAPFDSRAAGLPDICSMRAVHLVPAPPACLALGAGAPSAHRHSRRCDRDQFHDLPDIARLWSTEFSAIVVPGAASEAASSGRSKEGSRGADVRMTSPPHGHLRSPHPHHNPPRRTSDPVNPTRKRVRLPAMTLAVKFSAKVHPTRAETLRARVDPVSNL